MLRWLSVCLVQRPRTSFPHKHTPPLAPEPWAEGKRSTFGGVNSSISSEQLRNAVGVGDVFANTYPEREALVYLHDRVTYSTKTHQLSFLSPPAHPPAPL